MSYVPCTECRKPVIFESQRAYDLSGCHTNGGAVVYCSDCGGKDEYQDPAERMYRESLYNTDSMEQAEISKHEHTILINKLNALELKVKSMADGLDEFLASKGSALSTRAIAKAWILGQYDESTDK